jgi:ankyrin repeat protein
VIEDCQVDAHLADTLGMTPVFYAARYNHVAILEYLLEKCCVEATNSHGLSNAISPTPSVSDAINFRDAKGFTPIYHAIEQKRMEAFEFLLFHPGYRLSPNPSLSENQSASIRSNNTCVIGTILHFAVSHGPNGEILRKLLSFRGEQKKRNEIDAYSALSPNSDSSSLDVNALNDAGETPLFVAIRKAKGDDASNARVLIEFGADVNRCTCDGSFPLYMASCVGHLAVVKELIYAGADTQAR